MNSNNPVSWLRNDFNPNIFDINSLTSDKSLGSSITPLLNQYFLPSGSIFHLVLYNSTNSDKTITGVGQYNDFPSKIAFVKPFDASFSISDYSTMVYCNEKSFESNTRNFVVPSLGFIEFEIKVVW